MTDDPPIPPDIEDTPIHGLTLDTMPSAFITSVGIAADADLSESITPQAEESSNLTVAVTPAPISKKTYNLNRRGHRAMSDGILKRWQKGLDTSIADVDDINLRNVRHSMWPEPVGDLLTHIEALASSTSKIVLVEVQTRGVNLSTGAVVGIVCGSVIGIIVLGTIWRGHINQRDEAAVRIQAVFRGSTERTSVLGSVSSVGSRDVVSHDRPVDQLIRSSLNGSERPPTVYEQEQ